MKEFINKHLTAILGVAFALIVVIVLAVCMLGGNEKDKENPGTEISTETGTEVSTEVIGEAENTEAVTESTDVPSTEVVTDTTSSETTDVPSSENTQPQAPTYTYTELNKTMYAKSSVNVRNLPSTDGEKIGSLSKAQEVKVTGQCNETKWYRIDLNGTVAYVSNSYLVDTKPAEETTTGGNDTPSTGGDTSSSNGDTVTVNGMTLNVEGLSSDGIAIRKELANAGYYNPVWSASDSGYYMLIKRTDDTWNWEMWLRNYIEERGGVTGVGGGSNFCDTAGEAYCIYVEVVQ